jgi:hypothetical protein
MAKNLKIEGDTLTFSKFKGINNVDNAVNLERDELSEAVNVDIDNQGRVTRRNGYTRKFTPSGVLHSLWSNDRICLFIDGTTLKRLHEDYTATTIRTGVTNLPMEYLDVDEKIYYSNASVNGYIDTSFVDNQYAVPTVAYKAKPPTGQKIEWYNGRIYIVRNETIWFTDPYNYNVVDMRMNAVKMKDEVTMIKAVDDGLYIGIGDIDDRGSVLFLSGGTPEDFTSKEVANYGAIEGSAVKTKSSFVGNGDDGKKVLWTSRKGICLGENGGKFTNLTSGKYVVPNNRYGAGMFKLVNGVPQYIASLWT